MSKKGKILGTSDEQPSLKIDASKLDTIECEHCHSIFFEEVTMFKEIPAVQSPNGQKSIMPIPVVRCAECGFPSERFLPKEYLP